MDHEATSNQDLIESSSSSYKDYIALMKPRVMSLVVFTAFVGMMMAPGYIHPLIGFVSILCVTIGSGAAAAINMWYDSDIDAVMLRTRNRPTVRGVISPNDALAFGLILAVISVIMILLCINFTSALLLSLAIVYYVIVYTILLKRHSVQNVVVGGVAGALPPMIGWAAVTSSVSVESFTLFAIIFLWTPPHSWALSLFRQDDYRNCNIPMMPIIHGELVTKKWILYYSIVMFASVFIPYFLDMVSSWYLLFVVILNLFFCYYLYKIFSNDVIWAKKLFYYSIFYLFAIFVSLLMFRLT
jgi:protoheme IX farnesyltransferase